MIADLGSNKLLPAFLSRSHAVLSLAASWRLIVLVIIFVTRIIGLRDVMLILILWHTRVSLDDFRLIIGIIDSWSHLLLIVAVRVVGWVLLVMLVEYLSHISTWLVVTQAGLTLLLILSCCFNSVVLIRGCTILIVLACALFESLIVSLALVVAV